jgi:hypothetical protein
MYRSCVTRVSEPCTPCTIMPLNAQHSASNLRERQSRGQRRAGSTQLGENTKEMTQWAGGAGFHQARPRRRAHDHPGLPRRAQPWAVKSFSRPPVCFGKSLDIYCIGTCKNDLTAMARRAHARPHDALDLLVPGDAPLPLRARACLLCASNHRMVLLQRK